MAIGPLRMCCTVVPGSGPVNTRGNDMEFLVNFIYTLLSNLQTGSLKDDVNV